MQGEGDLIDGLSKGRLKLEEMKETDLPKAMQTMTLDERKAHVKKTGAERTKIQSDIQKLLKKRNAYLLVERKKTAGKPDAFEQDAVFTMNFTKDYNHLQDGEEWRGVRTKTASYAEWLCGLTELYDLESDPLEMTNLAGRADAAPLQSQMAARLAEMMVKLGDKLEPCTTCADWYDDLRRVVRNARGPLPDPEAEPDWSLLT